MVLLISILIFMIQLNGAITDGLIESPKVLAFWNLFADGPGFRSIVREQLSIIHHSGLYNKLDEIRYHTSGVDGSSFDIGTISNLPINKYKHVHNGEKATESITLRAVFDYCKANNPRTKVLYFHNKGSFHATETNLNFRHALDCFNLNPSCIAALDSFDTCGMRLSPLPHVHYPGNYWWATCGHISKLLDPLSFQNNATIIDYTHYLWVGNDSAPVIHSSSVEEAKKIYGTFNRPGLGSGRYFAEAWVGSLPIFKPADCLSLDLDNAYFNGYDRIPSATIAGVCPNVRNFRSNNATTVSSGYSHNDTFSFQCGEAAFLAAEPSMIKSQVEAQYRVVGAKLPKRLYDRSIYWYGQKPELVMRWLSKFKQIDKQFL